MLTVLRVNQGISHIKEKSILSLQSIDGTEGESRKQLYQGEVINQLTKF